MTPFDRLCYATLEPGGDQLGSRVYFDCDGLMKQIMRDIVEEETLQEWTDGHQQRMEAYSKQRRPLDDMDIG